MQVRRTAIFLDFFSDFFSFQASGERRLKVSYRAEPIANAFVKLKSQIALKSSRSPGTIRSTEMPGHSLESSLQIINYKTIPTVLEPPEATAKAV